MAYHFNGTTDGLAATVTLPAGPISIHWKFYRDSTEDGGAYWVITADYHTITDGWGFSGTGGGIHYFVVDDPGNRYGHISEANMTDNAWHDCTLRMDKSKGWNPDWFEAWTDNNGAVGYVAGVEPVFTDDFSNTYTHYFGNSAAETAPCDMRMAHVAIWGADFGEAEHNELCCVSPLMVRPDKLLHYWPMLDDSGRDIVGGATMSTYGTSTFPTVDNTTKESNVYMPSGQIFQFPSGEAAPAANAALLTHPHRHTNLGFG